MEPITQGTLGASCAQLILHKWDKRNAWLVGALAGMAADLDILIPWKLNNDYSSTCHRR